MKHPLGTICTAGGVVLMTGALFIMLTNTYKSHEAAQACQTVFQVIAAEDLPGRETVPVSIDGIEETTPDYAGILEIPALGLTLPVKNDWSYEALKETPCRYFGSPEGVFVIAAHNYSSHFGKLQRLAHGDEVIFTDWQGNAFLYRVDCRETLAASDTERMCSDKWDLTLFTCTYGGRRRIAIRCQRIE